MRVSKSKICAFGSQTSAEAAGLEPTEPMGFMLASRMTRSGAPRWAESQAGVTRGGERMLDQGRVRQHEFTGTNDSASDRS
jgi:hypothetical protein